MGCIDGEQPACYYFPSPFRERSVPFPLSFALMNKFSCVLKSTSSYLLQDLKPSIIFEVLTEELLHYISSFQRTSRLPSPKKKKYYEYSVCPSKPLTSSFSISLYFIFILKDKYTHIWVCKHKSIITFGKLLEQYVF